ncbi:putative solanesyl-diphosphate synthase 3, chloroplastic [Senna tora]|uniref:Putative solanesyl-diphosphate synthase 3, chloroplastic n=1 Tax=Senna tora TaxID=362788 RepID=A0A834WQ60_9FABA|nr:putative solanesyl-diphosphate synthase 3, chloroplastic [Senna tora]
MDRIEASLAAIKKKVDTLTHNIDCGLSPLDGLHKNVESTLTTDAPLPIVAIDMEDSIMPNPLMDEEKGLQMGVTAYLENQEEAYCSAFVDVYGERAYRVFDQMSDRDVGVQIQNIEASTELGALQEDANVEYIGNFIVYSEDASKVFDEMDEFLDWVCNVLTVVVVIDLGEVSFFAQVRGRSLSLWLTHRPSIKLPIEFANPGVVGNELYVANELEPDGDRNSRKGSTFEEDGCFHEAIDNFNQKQESNVKPYELSCSNCDEKSCYTKDHDAHLNDHAMKNSRILSVGGKRMRPSLVLWVAKAKIQYIEMMHIASLILACVWEERKLRSLREVVPQPYEMRVATLAGKFLFTPSSYYIAILQNLEDGDMNFSSYINLEDKVALKGEAIS